MHHKTRFWCILAQTNYSQDASFILTAIYTILEHFGIKFNTTGMFFNYVFMRFLHIAIGFNLIAVSQQTESGTHSWDKSFSTWHPNHRIKQMLTEYHNIQEFDTCKYGNWKPRSWFSFQVLQSCWGWARKSFSNFLKILGNFQLTTQIGTWIHNIQRHKQNTT